MMHIQVGPFTVTRRSNVIFEGVVVGNVSDTDFWEAYRLFVSNELLTDSEVEHFLTTIIRERCAVMIKAVDDLLDIIIIEELAA